jgi:hypothetical protein
MFLMRVSVKQSEHLLGNLLAKRKRKHNNPHRPSAGTSTVMIAASHPCATTADESHWAAFE